MEKHAVLVRFEAGTVAQIDEYRSRKRLRSRVSAIKELIGRGLAERDVLAETIALLRGIRGELSGFGVIHAGVFGSVARGRATDESDIDVLVEFDPARIPDLLMFSEIRLRIAEHVGKHASRAVDVVEAGSMRPRARSRALDEVVYAF